MGAVDKIKELEEQMAKTQKNKATEHHLGLLKAKIANLKREEGVKKGGAGGGGFDIKKSGNATVVFIGLPSTGKSSLLNAMTGAKSKAAAYAFTTLTVVPGMLEYKGAKIQLLDLPGIIAGAKSGVGRGKEVLAVARNADLILLCLDVFDPNYRNKLIDELEGINIRVDKQPPNIFIHKLLRGGLYIHFSKKPTHLNEKLVTGVLNEWGIFNANVMIRQDATVDELIDALAGNRHYAASLTVINKVDLLKENSLKKVNYEFIPVSATAGFNIDQLKEAIYQKLDLIRVYTKSKWEEADLTEPLMVKKGSAISDVCEQLHRDLINEFKFAQVWGKSAKHPGQKLGLKHVLADGDLVYIHKK